ncbi:MAG TPA: CoA pyrophosphatase [Salinisphaeraceae bacterium]|nr:CoA pyrophosphatase [Salinisphaeraceae bacterium]
MTGITESSTAWSLRIAQALQANTLDESVLYAGDDRRRFARLGSMHTGRVRKAAVLIPIIAEQTPRVILTERSSALRSHPGQISFPGGSIDPTDSGPQAAALRESHEEIGLDPQLVTILGRLPDYVTGTGFDIAPYVARLPAGVQLAADSSEVARMFTVPLAHVLEETHFRIENMIIKGNNYRFYVIEYQDNFIWGATAAMLYGLRESVALAEMA